MKQTLCGQLYDFETNAKLGGASGTLAITVYNAIDFAQSGPDRPRLTHGGVEIDGSGRFRIKDIDLAAAGPFIALAIDDAAGFGPSGNLVTTAVATRSRAGTATDQIEAWAVKASTAVQWAASGSFDLAQGAFVPVFRAHMLGTPGTDPLAAQSGVTFTSNSLPFEDDYFGATSADRANVDASAVATGMNGTVLVTGSVNLTTGIGYSGTGGLVDSNCEWERRWGVALPGVVFIQIFRPVSKASATCSL